MLVTTTAAQINPPPTKTAPVVNTEMVAVTSSSSPASCGSFTVLPGSRSGDMLSRKAGLLRLFNSDFFDANMAICYLQKYNRRDVGIQFVICEKMRNMSLDELEFVLPQICHLLVTNEHELPALEYFLLELCQQSLHCAIFSLWYLENYLADLRAIYIKNPAPYDRVARLLGRLQRSLFGESAASRASHSALHHANNSSRVALESSNPPLGSSIMGAACALAGVASPFFTHRVRRMVLYEARRAPLARLQTPRLLTSPPGDGAGEGDGGGEVHFLASGSIPSVEELHSGSAFSLRDYIFKAAKQMHVSAPALMMLSNSLGDPGPEALSRQSASLAPPIPIYYFAEMQFVMSLIDTSTRLVLVPKEGRLNALAAELTLINHNLPATLCLPLWCGSQPHHRILRICPQEASVLNSAERVPFLVFIEVLESDCSMPEFRRLIQESLDTGATVNTAIDRSSTTTSITTTTITSNKPLPPDDTAASRDDPPFASVVLQPVDPAGVAELVDYDDTALEMQPLSADEFSERMRTAAIMLAQLTRQGANPGCPTKKLADIAAIKERIIREMEVLEKNRLLDALQGHHSREESPRQDPLLLSDQRALLFDRDDPSSVVFREELGDKVARIKTNSPFGALPGWKLLSVIVKSGSDMRQEQLACQIIAEMRNIWAQAGLDLWSYPYRVLVAASNGGLIETVPNAVSLHSIKRGTYLRQKNAPSFVFSLRDHFIKTFGSPDSDAFLRAREAFITSLAAYSLITYLLQIKDRHDGNILLDKDGHLIHIDFGFMLSNSPGYVGFESAPFKLSPEYVELLGGLQSREFARFKDLLFHGFLELRKHSERLLTLVEVMLKDSRMPCFYSGESAVSHLRQRFHLTLTDAQLRQVVERLIISSAFNVFTKLYDTFQYYSNGIL